MVNIKEKLKPFTIANLISNLIIKSGGQVRFIGGSARDLLLNRQVADIDLATNLLPQAVEKILSENKIKYYSIGKDFGTITAIVADQPIEITSLRKDIHCDGRHAKVEFTDDWEEDAKRRDFTINSLSADLEGNIYDYCNGLGDLNNQIVRFIGNPEDRIMEDYLRILRFFRFSAYFAKSVDQQGILASAKYAFKLQSLSKERIKAELYKIFIASNAQSIITIMDDQQILQQIIPYRVSATKELTNFYQLLKQFNYSINPLIYFAILLRNSNDPDKIIKNFAFTRDEQDFLKRVVQSKITQWDYVNLKQALAEYKHIFKEVILVNLSHQEQENNYSLTSNLEKLFSQSIKNLPIKGSDLINLGVAPGKEMGKLLKVADQIWYDQEFTITKDQLLKKMLLYVNKP